MSLPTDRRIKLLYVSPQSFMSMFKEGFYARESFRIIKGIPEDAQMLAVTFDPSTFGILFVAYSSSFPEVPHGQQLPVVAVEIQTGV